MKIIAIYSVKGGSGSTTTVANLGAALHSSGLSVLLVDLCSENILRLYMGMEWSDTNGLSRLLSIGEPLNNGVQKIGDSPAFIPHGRDSLPDNLFIQNAGRLRQLLEQLDLPTDCIVLINCPGYDKKLCGILSRLADHTLLVMTADPACYASLQNFTVPVENVHCLVNRFDPLMSLERDIFQLLRADYPQLVLPCTVQRDESVREALAHKNTVLSFAPNSQATQDYTVLADWVRTHLLAGADYD